MSIPALGLTANSQQIIGSAHNGMEYLVKALGFVARGQVKPMVETFSFSDINTAYDKVVAGDVRFKAVITIP